MCRFTVRWKHSQQAICFRPFELGAGRVSSVVASSPDEVEDAFDVEEKNFIKLRRERSSRLFEARDHLLMGILGGLAFVERRFKLTLLCRGVQGASDRLYDFLQDTLSGYTNHNGGSQETPELESLKRLAEVQDRNGIDCRTICCDPFQLFFRVIGSEFTDFHALFAIRRDEKPRKRFIRVADPSGCKDFPQ